MRLTLPSGGWAELRDLSSLRARDQKHLMKSMNFDDMQNKVASGLDMTDGLIALLVTAWHIPYSRDVDTSNLVTADDFRAVGFVLPSEDPSVIDDLQVPDYGALNLVAQDAMKVMFPKNPDPSDYDDPTSPTEPANA